MGAETACGTRSALVQLAHNTQRHSAQREKFRANTNQAIRQEVQEIPLATTTATTATSNEYTAFTSETQQQVDYPGELENDSRYSLLHPDALDLIRSFSGTSQHSSVSNATTRDTTHEQQHTYTTTVNIGGQSDPTVDPYHRHLHDAGELTQILMAVGSSSSSSSFTSPDDDRNTQRMLEKVWTLGCPNTHSIPTDSSSRRPPIDSTINTNTTSITHEHAAVAEIDEDILWDSVVVAMELERATSNSSRATAGSGVVPDGYAPHGTSDRLNMVDSGIQRRLETTTSLALDEVRETFLARNQREAQDRIQTLLSTFDFINLDKDMRAQISVPSSAHTGDGGDGKGQGMLNSYNGNGNGNPRVLTPSPSPSMLQATLDDDPYFNSGVPSISKEATTVLSPSRSEDEINVHSNIGALRGFVEEISSSASKSLSSAWNWDLILGPRAAEIMDGLGEASVFEADQAVKQVRAKRRLMMLLAHVAPS